MSTRIAVFASGRGTNFEAILLSRLGSRVRLLHSNHADCGAVTAARNAGIPVIVSETPDGIDLSDIDRIVLAGYMKILSNEFVGLWPGRIINIHPSLLPAFPGRHAILRALESGESETGVTVHEVIEQVDAGRILYQEKIPIHRGDTLEMLTARIHDCEHRVYAGAIMKWIGE